MATLKIHNLGASYGERTLFAGLNLVVSGNQKVGLSGPNGAGKSTLLAILAGAADPAVVVDGSFELSPADASIGYLTQEVERGEESAAEFIERRTGVRDATASMDELAEALGSADVGDKYSDALEAWLALGGADYEQRLAEVTETLGLQEFLNVPTSGLSGGQAARVNLAVILLSQHDLLLLDEPTNDLDAQGLALLEEYVSTDPRPMMVVSHDREFLARTITDMVELDSAQESITVFHGGYDAYVVERARARQRAREAYEEYAAKREKLGERIQTQKTWLDKGVKNALKKAPDNDKILRNRSAARSEKQAGKIAQSERAIDRLTEVPEPRKEWVLHLELPDAPRSGQVVSVLHDEVVQLGEKTFGPWTVQLNYGDRVLIRGANGAGKTTLVRALCREENLGSAVASGSIDQLRGLLDQDVDLMTVFSTYLPAFQDAELRTLLAKFGLVKSQVIGRAARSLSPGERTRALMALLQATPTNFLVLDEPTNHLDVAAIEELERALQDYRGTVLLVSHDRRMVDSFRATRVLTVADGRIEESFPEH